MGDKSSVDGIENRVLKAFNAAWEWRKENPHAELEVLVGFKGYTELVCDASFIVNYDDPHYDVDVPFSVHGQLRGMIHGAKVFTPDGFNDNIIELKDTKGRFTYTIDLSGDE